MTSKSHLNFSESLAEQFKATLNAKTDWTGISWQDMETAIGPNADKYRALWDRVTSTEKKGVFAHFSPCWTGIPFLGVSWAVSRRMYPLAAMLLLALLVLNLAFPGESGAARALGIAILVSFTHKNTYLRWMAHCIRRIDAQGLAGPERDAALRAVGGLDQKSGWIAAGVLILVAVVLGVVFS
ncbi:hypothetical protein ASF11_01690 [Acidovorax sp. Leaf76]|uniref:hypothetical protein n=1 Tax=unclassified Acidovorax TaxID=2684926 RepID=UPI000701A35B|nr:MULTISPECIES: hypothetical protein [unclassified Acidovorax]KQO26444.1 hypothetical protein ASF11_01690 [Acidovorax sp. Leaf76]KQO40217.1 hypothetical protein ASF19_00725 [Acidovorax sp. Leaf84]KQS42357.1 hypothetical protein ASG27_00665 [Acidovorax sp. Leaf191]